MKPIKDLFLPLLLVMPLVTVSTAAMAGTLNGELVVMNASAHRFRVVGYDGSYVAPDGTPLDALDGKDVQVEIASNGKVEGITEVPVPIRPIAHGWSTARGTLEVSDATNGLFTLAGDDQLYSAPGDINVASYAGRTVEVRMDESGRVVGIDPVGPASLASAPIGVGCAYGGQQYSVGSAVCQSGMQYRCDGSQWTSLGSPCGDARVVRSGYAGSRSCAVGDATVADSSSVCRDGITFRCSDGSWIKIGTACR